MPLGKWSVINKPACIAFLLTAFFLAGCSSKPPPKFDYEKSAITINYDADKLLNEYNQKPHSLLIVIYQLTDVNAFNALAAYSDGLVDLLSAKSFDKSVSSVTKKYIEPESSDTLTLDRAAHTQHLGIVGGFNELLPGKSSLLFDLTYDTSRHGWLLKKRTTINPLKVTVVFGKDGLRLVEDKDGS